jgi:WD40 repeat protein
MAWLWAGVDSVLRLGNSCLVAPKYWLVEGSFLTVIGRFLATALIIFLPMTASSSDIAVTELPVQEYFHNTRDINKVRFSPSGKHLLAAGFQRVRVWDTQTHKLQSTLRGHGGTVQVAAFSNDGKRIATGGYDGTVRLWDTANGAQLSMPLVGDAYIQAIAFDTTDERVASANWNGQVHISDLRNGISKAVMDVKGQPQGIGFYNQNNGLIVGAPGRNAVMVSPEVPSTTLPFRYPGLFSTTIESGTDVFAIGKQHVYGLNEEGVSRWSIDDGSRELVYRSADRLRAIALSQSERMLVVATSDERVLVYDLLRNKVAQSIEFEQKNAGLCDWISSIDISQDEKFIAAAGCGSKVSVWSVQYDKTRR